MSLVRHQRLPLSMTDLVLKDDLLHPVMMKAKLTNAPSVYNRRGELNPFLLKLEWIPFSNNIVCSDRLLKLSVETVFATVCWNCLWDCLLKLSFETVFATAFWNCLLRLSLRLLCDCLLRLSFVTVFATVFYDCLCDCFLWLSFAFASVFCHLGRLR